jgi:hypothetical protein
MLSVKQYAFPNGLRIFLISLFVTIGVSAMVVAISRAIMFVRYGEGELCWGMFGWVALADSVSQTSHLVTIHPFFTEYDAEILNPGPTHYSWRLSLFFTV